MLRKEVRVALEAWDEGDSRAALALLKEIQKGVGA